MDRLDLPCYDDPDLPQPVTEEEWVQWCRDARRRSADAVLRLMGRVPSAQKVAAAFAARGEADPFLGGKT